MRSVTGAGHGPCEGALLERPRYYPRQIVTPGDMTLEQTYFRDRMRRHNRLLHGWGVVCGARVIAPQAKTGETPAPWTVRVSPGYLLGPCGDEIVIDSMRTWDIRGGSISGAAGQAPVHDPDPWCSTVNVERSGPVYIAVKFKELPSRPVRVQPTGCGCGENQCVYSRWRDGYELGVLAEPPDSYAAFGSNPDTADEEDGDATGEVQAGDCPECPECPADPWVVLARVAFDETGQIEEIDNGSYRRLVISHAADWQTCDDAVRGSAEGVDSASDEAGPQEEAADAEVAPRTRARSKRRTGGRRSPREEGKTGQDKE